MPQYTTDALVLGVHNWGQADKMLWLLSPDRGKIKAAAYGCRRPKSPLAGGLQLFNRIEASLNTGNQLDTLRQCSLSQRYRHFDSDLTAMAYASFVAELALELLPEGMPQPEIYQRLQEIFTAFGSRNPRLVALAAACQLLDMSGLQLSYIACVHCGRSLEEEARFAPEEGGAVCPECAAGLSVNLGTAVQLLPYSVGQGALLQALTGFDWQSPPQLRISRDNLLGAEQLILNYIQLELGKRLKSLEFLRQLA